MKLAYDLALKIRTSLGTACRSSLYDSRVTIFPQRLISENLLILIAASNTLERTLSPVSAYSPTAYQMLPTNSRRKTVVPTNSSERDEVKHLLKYILCGHVLLFDRGYPGYN